MNLEEIIAKLTPFFLKNEFLTTESFKDNIKYESNYCVVTMSYDNRDRSISIFVGRKGKNLTELTEDILKNFFNTDDKLLLDEKFVANFVKFLNGKGKAILSGDANVLDKLDEFANVLAKTYTENLMTSQSMKLADKAWSEKNYMEFINQLDRIEKGSLTETYLKKYQIALKKR